VREAEKIVRNLVESVSEPDKVEHYIARDGSRRRWRYPDAERPGWKDGEPVSGMCYDCRIPYGAFEDIHLPNDLWERINPTPHEGAGLLCPNCIFERLHHLGIYEVVVT
jgi:hypothetical protein